MRFWDRLADALDPPKKVDSIQQTGRGRKPPDNPQRTRYGCALTIIVALLVLIWLASRNSDHQPPTMGRDTSSSQGSPEPASSSARADAILYEQKARSEEITRQAVDLITKNRMAQAKKLYEKRWNELANLRVRIVQDETLSEFDRSRVEEPLKGEQEGVTNILSKFDELYGNGR